MKINYSLEIWFKIENYSVSNWNDHALQNLKKKINIPIFKEREREKERTRIQQGSLSVTSTFVQW